MVAPWPSHIVLFHHITLSHCQRVALRDRLHKKPANGEPISVCVRYNLKRQRGQKRQGPGMPECKCKGLLGLT